MVAHGVSIEERTEDRDKDLAMARERASLPWPRAIVAGSAWLNTFLTVDAAPSFIYKAAMVCAFPRLVTTTGSRGVAVGPEGVRVR